MPLNFTRYSAECRSNSYRFFLRSLSLSLTTSSTVKVPSPLYVSSVTRMACSGHECAASRTCSCRSAGTTSLVGDELPSMSLSWKESGAIIEHSVWPWQRSGSTHTFTVSSPDHLGFWRSGVSAAIDAQYLTGDVARFLGHQEGARGGNVFGLAHPAHRGPGDVLLDVAEEALRLGVAEHRGVDETRG